MSSSNPTGFRSACFSGLGGDSYYGATFEEYGEWLIDTKSEAAALLAKARDKALAEGKEALAKKCDRRRRRVERTVTFYEENLY